MEFTDLTKVVFQRIHKLDPENAVKIIGYLLLLEDYDEQQMLKLAFGTDDIIHAFIARVKRDLCSFPQNTIADNPVVSESSTSKFTPLAPSSSRAQYPQLPMNQQFINNPGYVPLPYLGPSSIGCGFHNPPLPYLDPSGNGFGFHNPSLPFLVPASGGFGFYNLPQFFPLQNQMQHACNLDGSLLRPKNYIAELARPPSSNQRCPLLSDSQLKFCENFNQGYCKYGADCKFLHVLHMENGQVMVLNPPNTSETVKEDRILPHGSFKKLEMEVITILESRRGVPVPISSLPAVYHEKYGRALQVEDYLKEIHRQGKYSGGGLTQLLARMNNRIRFIERSGEYCVILAEHIPEFLKFVEERKEQESVSVSVSDPSCQVYITFPPQSSFSQQDVYNYFSNFGPVGEVRIPNLEKRMFGFVTFVHPETVTLVLAKGNPHFIHGSEVVLVKPYRNKPIIDRKPEETVKTDMGTPPSVAKQSIFSGSCSSDPESRLLSTPRRSDNTRLLNEPTADEPKQSVDVKGKRIMEPEVIDSSNDQSFFSYSVNDLSFEKMLNCFEGASNGCSSKDISPQTENIPDDEKTSYEELKLPENPFAWE